MAEMKLNEWYEPTPPDWSIQRMKNIMFPREERSVHGDEELLSVTIHRGVVKRSEYIDEDEGTSRADSLAGYKVVSPTNLVNNIMKMSFRCLGVSAHEGIVSPAYSVFVLNQSKVDPSYLNFLLRIDRYIAEYRKLSKGIQESRMRLYDDFFLAMKVVVPPLDEQKRISHYLDKKISQIDSLVNKIEKKVELFKEQRTSLINQYMTKGLNPNVEMKDSGIEWIGKTPKHWKIIKTNLISENLDGKRVPLNSEDRHDIKGEIPYWGSNGVVDFINKFIFDEVLVLVGEDGSPFFDRDKPVSFVVKEKVWINNHIHVLRPSPIVTADWLSESFNVVDYKGFITGSTRDKLTQSDLNRIPHLVPPVEEQLDICSYINKIKNQINRLIELELRRIDKLQEYRQSIISSVTTGKVRVTEDMV
jgi:type I restriction enzyme S subunit